MKRIVFIGSGELAKDLCYKVKLWNQYEVVGFIDGNCTKGTLIDGLPVLGSDDDVVSLYKQELFDCIFIAVGYMNFQVRENIYNRFKGIIPFANIISPKAHIDSTAMIGEGVQLSDEVYVDRYANIEDNVMITLRSTVNHGVHIKKHTFFSTGVITAGHSTIGERCFIGVGCVVSSDITICDDVWLSPGSVVIKNIENSGHYLSQSTRLMAIPNK